MIRFIPAILVVFLVGCGSHETGDQGEPVPVNNELSASAEIEMPPTLGTSVNANAGQLGAALEWFEIPGRPGVHHLLQRSRDGYLLLTPNECFFPKLGLTAAGEGMVPDVENLNGGKSFAHVTGWNPGEIVEWGIWTEQPGALVVRVRLSSGSAEGKFAVSVDDQKMEFVPETSAADGPELVAEFRCDLAEAGKHIVRITNVDQAGEDTLLHWAEVTGPAIEGAAVLRKRWRPAAAHTRFSSPQATDGVRMWIMEMDAVPGELGFYAPITTPFGYYGPSWNADGTVKSGMNFSLWSYGRGKQEPPIGELSHLLAIGHREAKFSGFGHEGTGVKIRGWEPLAGRQGQRQAFALRAEPGAQFNTYFSYFYATDEQRWRLFGVGRQKPKRRPLEHLWVGSFVEVPGPPQRQRTGSGIRRMRYRGWVSQTGETWHPLSTMNVGDVDKQTGLTYTDRGLDPDDWFFMQTGGWEFSSAPKDHVVRPDSTSDTPEFLQAEKLSALLELPSSAEVIDARRSGSKIELNYRTRAVGSKPSVRVYHGSKEGLTLMEKWENNIELPLPKEGKNAVTFDVSQKGPVHFRLLLRNDQGQFWTWKTTVVR